MKKILFITINILCFVFGTNAQLLQTFTGDNFSGINAASLQPASIADSRYKFDLLLVGGQLSRSTNYQAYDVDFGAGSPLLPKYYRKSHGKSYYYDNQEVTFLSFMLTLTPKDAIGFTKKNRSITNFDGLDPDMALLLLNEMDSPSLTNKILTAKKLSYQQMKYNETAITYARVIVDNNERFLKLGATLKILGGQEATSLYSNDVTLTPVGANNVQLTNSQFSYGYSKHDSKGFNNKMGLGFDLGVVYEFRPGYKNYFYDMDGKKGIVRRDLNKYKLKLSASLLDVGRIKYTKTDSSGDFTANKTVSGTVNVDKSKSAGADINTFITSNFQTTGTNSVNTFKMNLPTALSLQADYSFRKNFYFGFMSYLPIWLKSDVAKVHNILTNVLSVRYEKTNYGISIPVSFVRNGQINTGLNIRYQAFTIGTTNLSSYIIGKRSLYDVNIYASMRFFIVYPEPADFDGDKVSDKKDECPNDPGPLSLAGCPDSDLDGVPDYKDVCPEAPGPIKLNGCPDTDGDGILDYLDACPTERGFAINTGCPDRDVDGILDVADRCPDVPGIKENNGCPAEPVLCCADSDGDGILDKFDDCPEIFGQLINKGCPADSNTTYHQKDINGKESKKMSEENSTKSEGVVDGYINAGPKGKGNDVFNKNSIAPLPVNPTKIVEEKQKADENAILKSDTEEEETADSNITAQTQETDGDDESEESETGSDSSAIKRKPLAIVYFNKDEYQVLPVYYKDLNMVAELLLKDKTVKLLLKGHTDYEGSDSYNIKLSSNRANAVKKYILKEGKGGIDKKRIEISFFGEKKPVTDNADEQKKQRNRRVELIIIQ